jgi:hypothetical protein
VNLTLEGPADARVTVAVASRDIAVISSGGPSSLLVPASVLIRGDNILNLKTTSDQPIKLKRLEVRVE